MTSGMVKTHWIGQSAAKLLRAVVLPPMEKVQRLSGSGLGCVIARLKIESVPPERVLREERPNQPGARRAGSRQTVGGGKREPAA